MTVSSRYVFSRITGEAVPCELFAAILERIQRLRGWHGCVRMPRTRRPRSRPAQTPGEILSARKGREGLARDRSGPWRPENGPYTG
jgi:hypothetical protein